MERKYSRQRLEEDIKIVIGWDGEKAIRLSRAKKVPFVVYLEPAMYRELQVVARGTKKSMNSLVRAALYAWLERVIL
jgi:hypothetical protein